MTGRSEISPWLTASMLALATLAVEWGRALANPNPSTFGAAVLAGGLLLCLTGAGIDGSALGLSRRLLGRKLLGGAALGAVLLLPAAARTGGGPPIWSSPEAPIALAIALGEEVAFRGALFHALRAAAGPLAAITGTAALFTAAHVLSHPPAFLLPIAATGLLLGTWRWLFDDLVAPAVGHSVADLSL